MKCRLIAAGTRLPRWIQAGFEDYHRRLERPISLELREVPIAPRGGAMSLARALEREERSMLRLMPADDYVVALEIRGRSWTTEQLARWLESRMRAGGDVAFLIGGPDGLSAACRARAAFAWSLSSLTLPHALVRLIVAEQIYRAASLIVGHPYHRG